MSDLKTAFRYHMRNNRPPFWHTEGHENTYPEPHKAKGIAIEAMRRARADVTAGTRRYPEPIRQKYRASESDGLRYMGRVVPETNRSIFDRRGDCGWLTDPYGDVFKDGSGLCFGVVYQLPGHKGESRFVAGYEFGGIEGGPTLDLSMIFIEPKGADSYWIAHGDKEDIGTLRDAARHADALAKDAAEKEREYQTAWQAGNQWAQEAVRIEETRDELRAILKERRALKGTQAPALCAAIRSKVSELLNHRAIAFETRTNLAAGDSDPLYFWPGEKRLQDAFCDGAGIQEFPA